LLTVLNTLFLRLSAALQIDLWTLDALWYYLLLDVNAGESPLPDPTVHDEVVGDDEAMAVQAFGLERHLHEFLRDNWAATTLGKTWQFYSEPGSENAGYEYLCGRQRRSCG
jgi:hypothetical protein